MNEIERIRERYERRKRCNKEALYSCFEPGNLFLSHERQRKMLAMLKVQGCANLWQKRILEIGCGTGGCLRELVLWGANPDNLYGIDLLEDRIEEAHQINPNIHYTVGNAETLSFENNCFDIVLIATCFTSILAPEMKAQVAREALRVLREDGIVLWYDFRCNNPSNPDVRGIGRKEIIDLFGDNYFSFKSVTLAPPIARRLARVSWLACELLSKLPFLRTHYLVVVKKRASRDALLELAMAAHEITGAHTRNR